MVLNSWGTVHRINVIILFSSLLPVLIEPIFLHDGGNLVRHFHKRVLGVERVVVLSQIDDCHAALTFLGGGLRSSGGGCTGHGG